MMPGLVLAELIMLFDRDGQRAHEHRATEPDA